MRVFVTGATGVIGYRLLPLLTSKGHEIIGPARSDSAGSSSPPSHCRAWPSSTPRPDTTPDIGRDCCLKQHKLSIPVPDRLGHGCRFPAINAMRRSPKVSLPGDEAKRQGRRYPFKDPGVCHGIPYRHPK